MGGKYSKPERPVTDKEGKSITEIQEQRDRWVEHFEELLNRSASLNLSYIDATQKDLLIDGHQKNQEWESSRTRQHTS
ncbi:unnamed protein product [Schistosoma margrebowiei]|uniref:Uncharacterized protein n=1 Tax=Schistosoma margrebowiei TaxID=48269 RepID=A0A3P8D7R0_9TREM|nr:unnamed protein product [Schistosoma margrebowiei]